ncbi:coupling of ubiquitin conjugation to ER degradation protein 1 [Suhomyces tanzawaensis NRRL Y-17324]|uniref:Coupling of ubiquitin conjugation to ER degradation protein 1 n=1 Tax=Suhomyces tanzawaensis NRRL Y-17324 TaxID=984487 RepID=A0A1E4SL19_9ASCO|nr:coupling of ubiquitin conjugation to ER degradation protein 1 [Suhomyces tanzawaensis NRRL Y-17324]ODV80215.1 coupling of ubiquitin conjugation to ER degradation protein 1 [Suhomyces tanzawaensis NRRL Y-17324]
MDSSTIIFIATLAVAFIFLRWLIAPIPEANEFNVRERTREGQLASSTGARTNATEDNAPTTSNTRVRRPVTDSMIEVVQTIGPQLTREQIIMDLTRTGSVELTVEAYMENGDLPHPPVSEQRAPETATTTGVNTGSKTPSNKINLLEKYDIDVTKLDDPVEESETSLHRRKQEMIIAARKRLESQLKNELDL